MWGKVSTPAGAGALTCIIFTLVFVQIIAFSNVQGVPAAKEIKQNATATAETNKTLTSQNTDKPQASNSSTSFASDYEWSNPDYDDTDDIDKKKNSSGNSNGTSADEESNLEVMPHPVKDTPVSKSSKETNPKKENVKEKSDSSTIAEDDADASTVATTEEEKDEEPSTVATETNSEGTEQTTDAPGTKSTATTPTSNSSSSPSPPPTTPISTQPGDGGWTNYTSTKLPPETGGGPAKTATWAVVTASVFVSFAIIFTILFFIRSAVIRRRKEDQAKLLRASISSEGYFFGDADGVEGTSNVHKFQL